MSPVACKLHTTQTDLPARKSCGLLGTTFPISEYICTSGMPNPTAVALSCIPAEKAIQKSGIWRHLFLSRCDQSGDLLLCFNSEVKGAWGMRVGIVCVCVCVDRGIEECFAPWWDPMAPGWPFSLWCLAVDVCQGWLDVQRLAQVRINLDLRTLCDLFSSFLHYHHHHHRRHHKPLISVSLSLPFCLPLFQRLPLVFQVRMMTDLWV